MAEHYSAAQQEALEEFQSDIGHLNALSNENRQRLLMILGSAKDSQGLKVNDLAEAIGLSQPATSHHLKALKDIGMVASHQEGNIVYYYLTLDDTIARLERLTAALKRRNSTTAN
ncbi:ArsR/SmtB family transcription factor [Lacticaseibacillus manihotivorans]|jgi:DNA-binding transcriptional ArsR family regulator|uniref:Transcriptional regulator n=2 Tax=Lacticaseibacillus manihotivorans TaxID=88233 RepID=A0A0R1QDE7_9LACO|nr:metalloregulator ArsR/SmtB family transcription factor [Lacticaseibacillus manihotivorans]KRL42775.1 transcriptional regulator [Lacticaseibacillus manihotivorans DSM 13343 = JCM 12514]QFQ92314.1 metalloregulator ArsR/SmtB family transcription factor [Lacticaseibacillus manihotivorans]